MLLHAFPCRAELPGTRYFLTEAAPELVLATAQSAVATSHHLARCWLYSRETKSKVGSR
jgi:hypothetical protein